MNNISKYRKQTLTDIRNIIHENEINFLTFKISYPNGYYINLWKGTTNDLKKLNYYNTFVLLSKQEVQYLFKLLNYNSKTILNKVHEINITNRIKKQNKLNKLMDLKIMQYKLLNQSKLTKKDLIYYYEKTIRLTEHEKLSENQIKKANKLKLFNLILDIIKYYLDCYTLNIITE